MSYKDVIARMQSDFEAHEDKDRAEKMSAYLKHQFEFYGLMSSKRKVLSQVYIRQLAKDHKTEYDAVARYLWSKPQREFHYCAIEFLKRTYKVWDKDTIILLEYLTREQAWWDTVDFIASHLVAHYVRTFHRDDYGELMDDWNNDDDFWVVRTSILFQLKYKEHLDWALLRKYILRHDESKEFFIRKAIGWVLREHSKNNPARIIQFINDNPQLSGLSKREALKHINRK